MTLTIANATEIARLALPVYGLDPDSSLRLLANRENATFHVSAHDGERVVRVHRSGYRSDGALADELRFIEVLRGEGVRVPEFVPLPDGRQFCVVGRGHPSGPHQVDLQLLIENRGMFGEIEHGMDGSARIDPADFHELGTLIALAHEATIRSGFTISEAREGWGLEGLIGSRPTWGDPFRNPRPDGDDLETALSARSRARALLAEYGEPPDRFGPIHSDLTPENVLRTDSGLALIDFNDFANGWHLFDVVTALYFYLPHPRYDEYRAELLRGYGSVRELRDEDLAVLTVLMFCRGLSYLGWAADRRGEPIADHHATWQPAVVTRLAHEVLRIRSIHR